jgi:hypothetical protein
MAIYHFNGQVIGRISASGQPKSPVSSAAYRSGEKLHDDLENKDWNYEREVAPEAHILAPSHAPEWATKREKLWNEVNKVEKNYNAQLAREFNIGLPRELTHEQQRELALDFCQEAFVDRGMTADIAIHRDDQNNPHFHVMLPVRPFNEDGSWGIKAKREYIYDKDGNHVLDKNGKKAFNKVNTTDWNSKDVFLSWRKMWAEKTNQHLRKNGINETISHLSNEDRGIVSLPTIHEGYAARQRVREGKESDRVNINKEIKKYNKTVSDLKKYKTKKAEREYQNKFARKFSPSEKKVLSGIAKELKMYVNKESIEERKNQLRQWKKSIQFRKDSDTKLNQLNRIEKEETLVSEAQQVFESEGTRFIEKHYPELDYIQFNTDEKIALVDKTIQQNRILTLEEVDVLKSEVESENLLKQINSLIQNRFAFTMAIRDYHEELDKVVKRASEILKINKSSSDNDLNKARMRNPKAYKLYVTYNEMSNNAIKAYALMHQLYDSEIRKDYHNINIRKMSLVDKETLVVGTEYYEKPITLESIPTLRRYKLEEQIHLIDLLVNKNHPDRYSFESRYPNFQKDNPRYVLLFKDECLRNIDELPLRSQRALESIVPEMDAHFMLQDEFGVDKLDSKINQQVEQHKHQSGTGIHIADSLNGVTGAMFRGLLESRDYSSKQQFEEDLDSKSKTKNKKRNIHSSGPSL